MNFVILHSATKSDKAAIAVFGEAMAKSAARRREARETMTAASARLTGTKQSETVSFIIWSTWNGCNQVGLHD